LSCFVNGVEKQNGTTKEMIFSLDVFIANISRYFTILPVPGDVIVTGTPPDVGCFI